VLRKIKGRIGHLLGKTPLKYWPVRVRSGLAKGARWTMLPYTSYWRGGYEQEMDIAIARLGNLQGKTCWDLGTHYGIYTVGLALAVGAQGQVASFEPDPISFARCQRHVRMNRLEWVKLYHAAVSDRTGESYLMKYGAFGTPVSHLPYDGEMGVGSTKIPVSIVALDDLVANGDIRKPSFIKIDVEGHGAKAVAGAIKTISEVRPSIIMGFHSPEEYGQTRDQLQPLGYSLFSCGTDEPFGWPDHYGDAGTDTFFVRTDKHL
jgi:FkbM family methyltransferase